MVFCVVDKLFKIGWFGVRKELEVVFGMGVVGIDVLYGFLEVDFD